LLIHLIGCQISEVHEKKVKRKFVFCLHTLHDGDVFFGAKTDEEKLDWIESIKLSLNKPPSPPPDKEFVRKTKPTAMYLSNRVIDTLTSMGAGGKVIKEYVSEDTFVIVDAIKSFITQYYGSEKAIKVEKQALSIAIKVGLLYKEKTISKEYFVSSVAPIRKLISKLIDGYEIPFTFSVLDAIDCIREVQKSLEQVLKPFLHEKTINKLRGIMDFLCNEDMLSDFFTKHKWKECEIVGGHLRKMWEGEMV